MSEGRFRRAYLGIAGGPRPLPPRAWRASSAAARRSRSSRSSTAAPRRRAGLRPEDLIVELDGSADRGMDELQRLVAGELIGRAARAKVVRDGRAELELVPAELDG